MADKTMYVIDSEGNISVETNVIDTMKCIIATKIHVTT